MTTCVPGEICANPGYVIIGGSTSQPGQVVITTTNSAGSSISYTVVPTTLPPPPASSTAVVATQTTFTAVPSITDLPACAEGCVFGYGGCDPLDVKCICTNKPYLDPIVSCVQRGCSAATVQAIYDFANKLCSGYGVEISTVVSYIPTTVFVPTTVLSTYTTTFTTTAPNGQVTTVTSGIVVTQSVPGGSGGSGEGGGGGGGGGNG